MGTRLRGCTRKIPEHRGRSRHAPGGPGRREPRLVEPGFAQLAEDDRGGLRYATFRPDDGPFVHVADVEGGASPLATSAFAASQEGIGERREPDAGPNPQPATRVGSYRLVADSIRRIVGVGTGLRPRGPPGGWSVVEGT